MDTSEDFSWVSTRLIAKRSTGWEKRGFLCFTSCAPACGIKLTSTPGNQEIWRERRIEGKHEGKH